MRPHPHPWSTRGGGDLRIDEDAAARRSPKGATTVERPAGSWGLDRRACGRESEEQGAGSKGGEGAVRRVRGHGDDDGLTVAAHLRWRGRQRKGQGRTIG